MKASPKNLYRHVEFLTGIQPPRNYENLDSLERVAEYIGNEFHSVGLSSETQAWDVQGFEYKNVIASYLPKQKKRLIIGAHYDVCGDQPGADDNASAVAGLLETARIIAESKPGLNYGIDFVAFNLEEPPFFGSQYMGSYVHAKSLYDRQVPVLGMICYEMIGYFSDEPGSQQYPSPELSRLFPDTADFIVVVGIKKHKQFTHKVWQLMRAKAGIDVQMINFPNSNDMAGLSDQRNYWEFGFDAVMINDTSFLRNPHYHEVTDTIDTLDFEKMAEVVNGCTHAVMHLA